MSSVCKVGVLVFVAVAGCESGEAVRSVARNSVGQVVSYEQALDAKIAAERKYYDETKSNLHKSINKEADSAEMIAIESEAVRAQARAVAVGRNGILPADLLSFGNAIVDRISLAREAAEANETALDQQVFGSLAAIDYDRKKVASVRKGLEELQREPETSDRAKIWADFLGDVQRQFNLHQTTQSDQ